MRLSFLFNFNFACIKDFQKNIYQVVLQFYFSRIYILLTTAQILLMPMMQKIKPRNFFWNLKILFLFVITFILLSGRKRSFKMGCQHIKIHLQKFFAFITIVKLKFNQFYSLQLKNIFFAQKEKSETFQKRLRRRFLLYVHSSLYDIVSILLHSTFFIEFHAT